MTISKRTLSVVFIIVLAATVAVHWPRHQRQFDIPAALTSADLNSLPDYQIIYAATTEIRFSLADASADQMPAAILGLPEAARHILALSWTEVDGGPGSPPVFTGFVDLLRKTPGFPTLAELADAYRAIGSNGAAATIEEAQRTLVSSGWARDSTTNPFSPADRAFLAACASSGTIKLLRAYVRSHVDDVVAARARLR